MNFSDLPKPAKPVVNLILDSGAFSAWRLGKPIDIVKYCDYLLDNADWIGHPVALDVINPQDPNAAAAASYENLLYMRGRGLRPVPVFHAGEDISWLDKMLDLGCDYVGISGSSIVSRNNVDDFYALAWDHLTTPSGSPVIKAHAFGEGRLGSMLKFPWASADSTSWIYDAQRNGAMTMEGGYKVTHRNDAAHGPARQDIDGMSEPDRDAFGAMLEKAGIDPDGFAERGSYASTVLRTYIAMQDCQRSQTLVRAAQPIKHHAGGLLGRRCQWIENQALPPFTFNYHLVIGGNPIAAACLAYGQYHNALISYFYIGPAKGKGNNGNYGKVKDFVMDPKGMCASQEQFVKAYRVLERFVDLSNPMQKEYARVASAAAS